MNHRSLKTNALLNTIKTVISLLFPLITFPYVSRVLQVEEIGIYNFSASVISYFALLAGLGISTYAIREGPQYREDRKLISKFVSEVFSINLWSTIISYILLLIAMLSVEKLHNYTIAILILATEMIFNTLGVNWVCNIFEDFLFITIQSISVQALSLILTLLLVKSPSDINIYIGIVAFSKSAANIANYFYIRYKYCKFQFKLHCGFRKHIKPILIIFSTSIAISIYVNSDTTMLGFMTNDYQVGLYSTAVKIYTIVKNILSAALIVLIPRFSLLLQCDKKEEANHLFSRVFNVLTILMLPSIVGLFITSEDVIHLIGGSNYLGGTNSLRLLCVAIAFSLIAYLYTQCILIPKKKEKVVFIATTISAAVNIGLNFVFIPLWGINGAAITTIIAEAIVCVMSIIYSKSDIKLGEIANNLFSVIIGCIGISIVGWLCYRFLDYFLIRLLATMILSAVIYAILLVTLKNSIVLECVKKIRKK